jgi:hypothetical protein
MEYAMLDSSINKFDRLKTNYFFLDNLSEIFGLFIISNLNSSKHVYLYNLITQLKHRMGYYIYDMRINDDDLVKLFENRENS